MHKNMASEKAEEIAREYNPKGLSPFPFKKIQENKTDLIIFTAKKDDDLDKRVSGAIGYNSARKEFLIVINGQKSKTRQYFTTAHELGHYFLHKEYIKKEEILIDGDNTLDGATMLYRLDDAERSEIETEANNFAASLIMPADLTVKAWNTFRGVEECAKLFRVSVSAMSIRLERLGLIN